MSGLTHCRQGIYPTCVLFVAVQGDTTQSLVTEHLRFADTPLAHESVYDSHPTSEYPPVHSQGRYDTEPQDSRSDSATRLSVTRSVNTLASSEDIVQVARASLET